MSKPTAIRKGVPTAGSHRKQRTDARDGRVAALADLLLLAVLEGDLSYADLNALPGEYLCGQGIKFKAADLVDANLEVITRLEALARRAASFEALDTQKHN